MNKEDLLIPRWKVIADYPSSHYIVGSILTRVTDCNYEYVDPQDYPAIFQQMSWWEERTEDEMPKFIKNTFTGVIYNIESYKNAALMERISSFIPATEEEYNLYNTPL